MIVLQRHTKLLERVVGLLLLDSFPALIDYDADE